MTTQVAELLAESVASQFTNGLWPAQARDKCPAPYGTFIHFGEPYMNSAGECVDQRQRLQIDCWEASYLLVHQLADQVHQTMKSYSLDTEPDMFSAILINREYIGIDEDVKLHRVMLEYSFWYRPALGILAESGDNLLLESGQPILPES